MKWIKKGLIFKPPSNLGWMKTHAAVPLAEMRRANLTRIYFSGRDTQHRSQTGFIEVDIHRPQSILAITQNPVLQLGRPGTFDDSGTMASWIVHYQGKEFLYYIGWNKSVTVPFRNSIGLAISTDEGRTFSKFSEGPLIDRDRTDPYFVASLCILIDEGIWKMWYLSCLEWELKGAIPKHRYHIKYAESHDGIEWRKTGVVCIDFKGNDEYAISRPCVLKEHGIYKMWYSYRGTSYRIGYAESKDGLHWERKDDEVGIDVSDKGWDSEMIEYPFVFDHTGERYMLYNGNGYGESGIGLARMAKDR
ncbi:MAG: hypothetical protein NPIRA05_04470 [Nitrospirales bacterium]|nr:MAG: hypothetical protein NPIRA05_04470 [Nitrospirales bacterium]